jgi:hypothetical protein
MPHHPVIGDFRVMISGSKRTPTYVVVRLPDRLRHGRRLTRKSREYSSNCPRFRGPLPTRVRLQNIEIGEDQERFNNLLAVGEGGRCLK